MNKTGLFAFFWPLIKVLVVCCFCLFWVGVIKWPFTKGNPELGRPFYDKEVHLYWGEISDYLIYSDKLVVLYDAKRAVQFYSLSGEPLFTYEFAFQNNGRSHLHADGISLIVEDHRGNFYVFSSEGEFLEFISDKSRKDALSNSFLSLEEARTAKDGSICELRGSSIFLTTMDKSQKIVSRPFFMAIYQGGRVLICAVFFAALLTIRHLIKH